MQSLLTQSDTLLASIFAENRKYLLEHEIYQLLSILNISTPKFALIKSPEEITSEILNQFPGNRIVAKVVSPNIFHKTDVGGVKIITKNIDEARHAYQHFSQVCLEQKASLVGMILCEFVEYSAGVFASEILFGIRWSKDFGLIITVGLGGVETDLLGQIVKEISNVKNSLVATITKEEFEQQITNTLMYRKLTGKLRGSRRQIEDKAFLEPLWQLVEFSKYYSPWGQGKALLEEMEFNPMVASNGRLLALDAKIRFTEMQSIRRKPNLQKIKKLLQPESLGIVGASSKAMNMGRIILNNIIQNGFAKEKICVIKDGIEILDGCRCVPEIAKMPEKVDTFIIAVNAAETPKIIHELLEYNRAESVIIIPGGMGEKEGEGQKIEANIKDIVAKMPDAPVLVGPNCLGIRSIPGKYDTFFIPEHKMPKGRPLPSKMAMVSQSGAFIITKLNKLDINFHYAISTGNQIDLGTSDYLGYFMENPDVNLLAFYVEGFGYLDGLAFAQYAKEAIAKGKKIIGYKAGKTTQGQSAALGHTASVAGEYQVSKNVLKDAGVFLVDTFQEFEDSIKLFSYLDSKKIQSNRIGLISNAGFETVGMADNSSPTDAALEIPKLNSQTIAQIEEIYKKGKIQEIANIRNPLDITPSANDMVYEECAKTLLQADYIDAVIVSIVPFSPVENTLAASPHHNENIELETSFPKRLIRIAQVSNKPVIAVVDAGKTYEPLVTMLQENNIPVFRNADRAVTMLARYITYRLKSDK